MPFASYYAVRASQLGMTAQELYASRRVQFRAGGEIGGDVEQAGVLDQGDVAQTPQIDEQTGLPLNADGTVTVYHHTSADNAEKIRMEGRLLSSGEPDLYFTTSPETDTGYGDTSIPVRVRPERLRLDDEFPSGRRDYSVPAPSRSRRLRFLPDGSAELKQRGVDRAGADAQAAQREHAETERAYGGREAYEAAKAAGRTKLNFFQWVQVRTPRFKQWFGDWELSALRGTMRDATGSDLARRAAAEFLRQPITNVETGLSAVVSKGSLDKMLSQSAVGNSVSPQAHAMAVANLDRLFMLATRRLERADNANNPNIRAIHHFDVPMPFDGEVLRVKMLVKEMAQADQASPLYTVAAVEIEKPASSRGDADSPRSQTRLPAPPAGFEARFAQMVAAVNGEGVSTVTDPDTGEPLVVYHGAPDARFLGDDSTFKSERERYGGAMGRAEAAHWFASSRRVASTYADARRAFDYQNAEPGVLDAWLQLKNPLVIDAGGAHWRTAQQRGKTSDVIEQARRDGHDGVIIRRVRDDYSTLESGKRGEIADTYAVFSSPQIKSATANVGTFSQDDGNILHQEGRASTFAHEMQRARAAKAQFETDVDAAMARTGKQSHMARLGQPSAVLRALGLPNLPVVVSRSELQENRHGIPDRIIKSMPILMADPVAVFKSADPRHPDRLVVVTSAMHNGGPVVAVVQPNAGSNMGPVNLVTSFHPKDPANHAKESIGRWIAEGRLVYANKRKGPDLEGAIGVQFPKVQPSQGLAGAKVLSEADVFKPAGEKPLTQGQAAPRGSFSRDSLTVKLLQGADLTTVMHEGAHFFFENDIAMASDLAAEARANGLDALKPGERQILADVSALFRQHGIQGDIIDQLDQWHSMSPEEQRSHHERTAEWFETYLASGKAPSIEMQPYFRKFRQWFLNVYGSVKRFIASNPEAGKLNDEVRGVFDRMLATNEQIVLAEQARSMIPIFETAEQAGMRPEEFQAYQALNMGQTQKAVEDLQARALDDMRWIRGIRSRAIKRLTREERGKRSQMRIEARREVMSQPVYIAWRFLTGKITKEDRIGPLKDAQSNPDHVMPDRDSLFTAIAKLGGVDRAEVKAQWGVDQKTQIAMPVFGKPVMRKTGGLSIDSIRDDRHAHRAGGALRPVGALEGAGAAQSARIAAVVTPCSYGRYPSIRWCRMARMRTSWRSGTKRYRAMNPVAP